jgi:peptidyl-prolyl cis-trans isomerase C
MTICKRAPLLLLLAALAAPLAVAQPPAPAPAPQAAKPAAAAKPVAKSAPSKPYLTVNGYPLSQALVDAFVAEQKLRGVDTEAAAFQNALREEMIRRGALLAEAQKRALDKRPEYKRQLELSAQLLLMREAIADHFQRQPLTEAELEAAYRNALTRLGETEYRLRHIQSKTEAEAKEIAAQLAEGKKFDKLLKRSTDEATRDKGGDLGWKIPLTLPTDLAERLRPLKKGEHTQTPVKLGENWHVFRIEEQRPLTPPKREELLPQLRQGLVQLKTAQYLESLRASAQVK